MKKTAPTRDELLALARLLVNFTLYKPYQPLLWTDLEAAWKVRDELLDLAERA